MLWRVLISFITFVGLIAFFLFRIGDVAFLGPSPAARDQLTLSLLETSAAKFVPGLFMPEEFVHEIILNNAVIETEDVTDVSMITIHRRERAASGGQDGQTETGADYDENNDEWADYPDGIRIENVRGNTYNGYMMLIRDPSRVYCATSSDFRSGQPGRTIMNAYAREGAAAAINGGGFPDDGGVGAGDLPLGLVFSKGIQLWGDSYTTYSGVMGFNNDDVLVVGSFSPSRAKEMGIRDALCFGPILVVNGEPAQLKGAGSGLNPRSAIGQRADGAVLFLAIEGRMPSSMGASYNDLIEVMLAYGAVNAGNLDGGGSTTLMYEGEQVNLNASLYGPRHMPTFFMVRPVEAEDE